MKKTYLFDFDGTLVDSMPTYGAVMLRILDENGIPYGKDMLKTITPLGLIDTAHYYIKLGIDMSHEEILKFMYESFYEEYKYRIPAKENVIETLRKMKARGDDLNILTASPHITLDACLARLGITELFTNIWSCDDFGTNKSDPTIYKMAAKRMNTDVRAVVFVDDNLQACKTAKEAGMQVYGIYDDSSSEYIEDIKKVTDRYVYDFADMLK